MDNLTATDDKDVQNQVNKLIREDLASDLLNEIGAKASWLKVDKGQSLGKREGEEEDTGLYLNNNLPHVALWYWNAIMKKIWKMASSSQQDKVEKQKKEDKKDKEDFYVEIGDDESTQNKVNQLQRIITFVTHQILSW